MIMNNRFHFICFFLELNASDERGILVIREKVKRFAQQSASGVKMSGEKCPPFKIIILDEADCMTSYAQSCLRRIMEKETKSTRFCIICNYITRIIDPIVSRCSKFRFKPLHQDIVISKLESICENESLKLENDQVLLELIKVSNGDLRKAITFLQTTYRLKGFEEALSVDDIREVSGFIPKRWIKSLIKACENQSHENVEQVLNNIIAEGFAGNQLVLQLHDWVISDKCQLSDSKISVICEAIASTDHCLLEGANEFLQLFHLASIILQQMEN